MTATVSNPNYTGTGMGTLTIGKAVATVALANSTQTYTGSSITVTGTTTFRPERDVQLHRHRLDDLCGERRRSDQCRHVFGHGNDQQPELHRHGDGDPDHRPGGCAGDGAGTRPSLIPVLRSRDAGSTTPSGLTLIYSYTGTGGTTYGPSATPPANAGSYTVTETVTNPNYIGSGTGTLTIAKAPATVSLANSTQTYTGSSITVTGTTTPSGLSATYSYTGTGSTTYAASATGPINAGTVR